VHFHQRLVEKRVTRWRFVEHDDPAIVDVDPAQRRKPD